MRPAATSIRAAAALGGMLLATLLLTGCPTSWYVFLTTRPDARATSGGCFDACARAFGGQRPGSCGPADHGAVRCAYDGRAPSLPGRSLSPAACRAACAAAGLPDPEACAALTSLTGEPVVACSFRVGYH